MAKEPLNSYLDRMTTGTLKDRCGYFHFLSDNVDDDDVSAAIPIIRNELVNLLDCPLVGNDSWEIAIGFGMRSYARLLDRIAPSPLPSEIADFVEVLERLIFSRIERLQAFGLTAATFDAPRYSHAVAPRLRKEMEIHPNVYCDKWHEWSQRCLDVLASMRN